MNILHFKLINMKKCNQLIILLLIASNTFAQSAIDKSVSEASTDLSNKLILKNKKKIVVLYITDIGKTQTTAGKYIADVISDNIVNNAGNFEVFDRENLLGIAEAKKLIAEGYIDVEKAKALGQMLSVEVIIVGNYTVLSNTLKLTLKALDSNTGFVIASTMKDLPIDLDAGALLGINVETNGTKNNSNRGFNNRPLNSNENYNNPETVNKDCEKNNTGDYCFTNNTQNQATVTLLPTRISDYKYLTLEAGQTQCFYNLQVQSYDYVLQVVDGLTTSRSGRVMPTERRGQIFVEKCKSKTFDIK